YGLTESYGPAALCAWQEEWEELDLNARSRLMARQGVRYTTLEGMQVADPRTHEPVPRDGRTMGELMLRGNTIMKGYLRNERATPCAFVVLKAGASAVSEAEIVAWCREHLAGFKVPKKVVFGDLPKTSTGKIQKFVLRDRARDL